MIFNDLHLAELNSSFQTIRARVEIYKDSALEKVCDCGRDLSEFSVERTGEGKFFGYGICQKLRTTFLDEDAALSITKENSLVPAFDVNGNILSPFPKFYVEEVTRDEETGDISVTAFDVLYKAANHTVSELSLPESYSIYQFAVACGELLGATVWADIIDFSAFETVYEKGANFEGTETIRDALNAIAEATQTIYFINDYGLLTFRRLDRDGAEVAEINRRNYYSFTSNGARVLSKVSHVTELGDNVEPASNITGVTQYVRNNPFWELRTDIATLVDNAQAAISGLSIEQFEANWFGNYLLEIGDKLKIVGKENKTFTTYLLDDLITFNGELEQTTKWSYTEDDEESASNPTSLGAALNQTFARVDKVNQEIEIVAERSENNESSISQLNINTNGITSRVEKTEQDIKDTTEEISTLRTEIKQSAEQVKIEINQELEGKEVVADKVAVSTGFTFDENGLTIDKSDSEIKTTITEDGMTISKNNETLLTANNQGVSATDLRASTYLEVGGNSRFQTYVRSDGTIATACFWIG